MLLIIKNNMHKSQGGWMVLSSLALMLSVFLASEAVVAGAICPAALDYKMRPLAKDQPVHLCDVFSGKVVLIVNTASKCAYTDQYAGLEALYDKYKDSGLVVAGFPSNDFAGQEPGSENKIQEFCRLTYGVRFPMFEKTRVKGAAADPFYQHLKAVTADEPRWNFHKYLIDRQGNVVASFASHIEPGNPALIKAIEQNL